MPLDPDQLRREDCRWAVLSALARRPASAFDGAQIRTVLLRGHDFSLLEVEAALTFLEGMSHIASIADTMGATKSFQVTSTGILAHERR